MSLSEAIARLERAVLRWRAIRYAATSDTRSAGDAPPATEDAPGPPTGAIPGKTADFARAPGVTVDMRTGACARMGMFSISVDLPENRHEDAPPAFDV